MGEGVKTSSEHAAKLAREERAIEGKGRMRKEDGARIRELRNALQYRQEEFARLCGVARLSALAWETGKTSPAPRNWKEMAKLAGKAMPSMALWFWEKAGIERDDFQHLFPEFQKLARDSEKRIQEKLESTPGDAKLVPLVRASLHAEWRVPPAPEQVEDYLSLPRQLVLAESNLFAVHVSQEFIRSGFGLGDILLVDPSETDIQKLEGEQVLLSYSSNIRTKAMIAADILQSGHTPEYKYGRWPHIDDGIYVGWLNLYASKHETGFTPVCVDSARVVSGSLALVPLEFSVPVATLNAAGSGKPSIVKEEEVKLHGRVVGWFRTASQPAKAKSVSRKVRS